MCHHGLLVYLSYMVYDEIKKNPMKEKELNKYHLLPLQMVYSIHYIFWATGRLYHTKGKSDPSDMYSGGSVLIDHASGYIIIKHQVAINATENVKANSLLRGRIKFRE